MSDMCVECRVRPRAAGSRYCAWHRLMIEERPDLFEREGVGDLMDPEAPRLPAMGRFRSRGRVSRAMEDE